MVKIRKESLKADISNKKEFIIQRAPRVCKFSMSTLTSRALNWVSWMAFYTLEHFMKHVFQN
jgi:hypothetical protein